MIPRDDLPGAYIRRDDGFWLLFGRPDVLWTRQVGKQLVEVVERDFRRAGKRKRRVEVNYLSTSRELTAR
jgi:hypothetical protein